jgi:hypothetical protein
MSRKRCIRRIVLALPPRGLRPRLAPDQVRDLGLAHVVNLDVIARGEADEAILWQWVGGILTWSRVAELLQAGVPEMHEQLELATRLIERYGRTGRVGFSGPDYQAARDGLQVMDRLAEIVDKPTALAAVEWSEHHLATLQANTNPTLRGDTECQSRSTTSSVSTRTTSC